MKSSLGKLKKWDTLDLKMIIADLILIFFSWGGYYRSLFGNGDALYDTINTAASKSSRLSCYRWMGWVVDMFAWKKLGFLASEHPTFSLALFLLFLTASLFIIQKMFRPLFETRLTTHLEQACFIAATALIFINGLLAELFYFTESYSIFKFSLLFCAIGCLLFSRKHYVWGMISFLVMTAFYQISCALAAILLSGWLYLKYEGKLSRSLFVQEFLYICAPMSCGALNYVTGVWFLRFLKSRGIDLNIEKKVVSRSVVDGVLNYFREFRQLLKSNLELMPAVWLPLLVLLISFFSMAIYFVLKKKWNEFGTLLLLIAVQQVTFGAIPVANGVIAPRIMYPFYGLEAGMLLGAMYILSENEHRERIVEALLNFVRLTAVLFLVVHIFFIQIIISNRMISNTLDLQCAEGVLNVIRTYEAETGQTVKYLAAEPDTESPMYYKEVYYKRDAINDRNYRVVNYSLIEYVASPERHFEKTEMDPRIFKEHFEGKNWDAFDAHEQIVIEGDTAYICIF
ncbi:MAG: glucosyltransferase domain-containing protein [Lachnospiraceae bacterium]|nr:glucosyltransferase domain-containing protein [Lachnospiraceae bacterium]